MTTSHELPGLEPVDRDFGNARGEPVDRWYIHTFLWERREHVRGRVLEVADSGYTDYLGEGRVERVDVLHAKPGNPLATIVGDLVTGAGIPEGAFDCIVLTQTLQYIYELQDAVRTIRRSLAHGGVVLATVPGISQISRQDRAEWGEYWRFTIDSARRLFADEFGADDVEVVAYGNVLTASALLYGYAQHELTEQEFAHRDEDYEVLIGVRAVVKER